VLESQLDYWREQLGGELPELELPFDRPRPARQSYRGVAQRVELSEVVVQRLKEIARETRRDVVHDVAGCLQRVALAP
jgi:hypothetical protein